MKSVSVCLRRLRFLISRSLMRIYIPSHKMRISDLEVYFEKSVCNAKHIHTSIHSYFSGTILKGKVWFSAK